jgi:methylated-DNA-[protein]-cysteine S-methyltransferase
MTAAPATALIETPIGIVELVVLDGVLTSARIDPIVGPERHDPGNPVLDQAAAQVRDYFSHQRRAFDLPLARATTPRGNDLRAGIASIPYGETLTYGQLAYRIGSSARAVGQACQRNPFPLIIPCHRVTSSGNAREHYSGGAGPETKAWLLDFEAGRTRLL